MAYTTKDVISKNQVLTLAKAKELTGKSIAVCCKNEKTGDFNPYIDRIYINQVSKIKGGKGHVILDASFGWSYHCINGKTFTLPDFQTGNELTVYFIEL